MADAQESLLFSPLKVGECQLLHRLALAPLTRNRADDAHVHTDIAVTYYEQRASYPGTLLITEATFIASEAGGYSNVPGVWSPAQIAAWKKVTDAVHAKGSFIFCQLWALGRAADADELAKDGHEVVSSSNLPLKGGPVPRPLTKEEIKKYIGLYAQAAKNSIEAGFDGVELHGANGYLIDQFTQDVCNNRTDEYGGSIENRTRFALEAIDAVVKAIGASRTGIRISPWSQFQEMKMKDPKPTFSYLVQQIRDLYPDFAYIHATLPRVMGNVDREPDPSESNAFIREVWKDKVLLSAGGYTAEKAKAEVGTVGDVIVFGRYFISNPDLPYRIKNNIPLTKYQRDTFYLHGPHPEGYIDYPTAEEEKERNKL